MNELRYAVRRLARSPGFSATVLLLLGLAFGIAAGAFGLGYGLAYKALPFADAERLVVVDSRFSAMNLDTNLGVSVPYLEDIAHNAKTLRQVAAWSSMPRTLRDESDRTAAPYVVAAAQPSLFRTLGVEAAAGRLFADEDAASGAAPVALLDWDTWQTRFGAAPEAIGRILHLDGHDYRIIGVLPRTFRLSREAPQLWLPLTFTAEEKSVAQAGNFMGLQAIARLAPGADIGAASGELAARAQALDGLKDMIGVVGFKTAAQPLRTLWLGQRAPALRLMALAAILVLLLATANVCNLYLARQLARRHEAALCAALGAPRSRLLRQALAETFLLAVGGALVALAWLPAGFALLRAFELAPANAPQAIGLDAATCAFLLALAAVVAGAMAGAGMAVLPRRLGQDAGGALAQGSSRLAGSPGQRARQGLLVLQIALTAALLVGTGLLLRSSHALLDEDVGFDREHLLMAALALPPQTPATEKRAVIAALRTRAAALPGVRVVGVGSVAPFGVSDSSSAIAPPGSLETDPQALPSVRQALVDDGYFAALGQPLIAGRGFTPEESASGADVAVVDADFVARYCAGRDPLGQRFRIQDSKDHLREVGIVGVAATAKLRTLDEHAEHSTVYQPGSALSAPILLLLRSAGHPDLLRAPLQQIVADVAPQAQSMGLSSMREWIEKTVRERLRLNRLLELLGALAVLLAAVGQYAVLAYAVRLRHGEFGVRLALGAPAATLLRGVLAYGARLTALGLLLALPLAYAFGRVLETRLYRVSAFDGVTLVAVGALLAVIGLGACALPAWRAARIDPAQALRRDSVS
jgi:putative ABC transport system permease protein